MWPAVDPPVDHFETPAGLRLSDRCYIPLGNSLLEHEYDLGDFARFDGTCFSFVNLDY